MSQGYFCGCLVMTLILLDPIFLLPSLHQDSPNLAQCLAMDVICFHQSLDEAKDHLLNHPKTSLYKVQLPIIFYTYFNFKSLFTVLKLQVFCLIVYFNYMDAWCLQNQENCIRSSETGITLAMGFTRQCHRKKCTDIREKRTLTIHNCAKFSANIRLKIAQNNRKAASFNLEILKCS